MIESTCAHAAVICQRFDVEQQGFVNLCTTAQCVIFKGVWVKRAHDAHCAHCAHCALCCKS
jgi:hypothetical protein